MQTVTWKGAREATGDADGLIQVRLGGFGGQGVVIAGLLLGKAAALFDGKEAVCTQTHGPEARGGASRSDVIISAAPVDYPFVATPDILAVLFQESYLRFRSQLKPDGVLIIETDLVHPEESDARVLGLPATRIAQELGNKIVANVVLLGYLVGVTDVVSREAVEQAIRTTFEPKAAELNLRAHAAGFARAERDLET